MSPFQLAILSGMPKVLKALMSSTIKGDSDTLDERLLVAALGQKAEIAFQGRLGFYGRSDRELGGMNAFHAAAKYSAACLGEMAAFIRERSGDYLAFLEDEAELSVDLWVLCLSLVDSTDNPLSMSPLHMAAENPDAAATRHLLGLGARPDPKDVRGYTPLHLAAKKGREVQVAALLQHGADPDVVGEGDFKYVILRYHRILHVVKA